jgi:hypothetical protein
LGYGKATGASVIQSWLLKQHSRNLSRLDLAIYTSDVNSGPDPRLQQLASQADSDPFSPIQRTPKGSPKRPLVAIAGLIFMFALAAKTGSAQSVWQVIAQFIGLHGKPEPASANVLSEHETEGLDQMAPQAQAELLLERSINHYRGANDEIAKRVDSWLGKLSMQNHLQSLYEIAINSDDLRVRAASLEIDLASRNLVKNASTVDQLENDARYGQQGPRVNAIWDIALLGNRGVEPQRAFEIISSSIHDSNPNVHYWAVESLSYLGTDETIDPLLDVFRNDPSPNIRERAACGRAQSGMLSEKQRRTAVPKLLDFAEDASLDATTRGWVFQALRDITGQNLPHDAAAWRNWYNSGDPQWNPVTRDSQ